MKATIEIVDRGRGPQLSTSRITVQDILPYLQKQFTHKQIQEIMPVLTVEEIQVVEQYVQEHFQEVMAQDQRIRQRAAARRIAPDEEEAERQERLERLATARQRIRHEKLSALIITPTCKNVT